MIRRERRRRRRLGLLAAILVIVALVQTVRSGPVALLPPQPSAADASSCAALVARLPGTLDGRASRQVTPLSPLTAAWGRPAITLRCGLPAEAHPVSANKVCLGAADATCWYQDVFDASLWVTRTAPHLAVHIPAQDGFADVLAPVTAAAQGR